MGEFSISHLVIIAVILLVFFGPSRLPGLGQSLGKAIRGFKEGINDLNKDETPQAQNQPPRRSEQIPANDPRSTADHTIRDVHTDTQTADERDPTRRS
jgi:sec-independent protein translocase protein TatA